MRLLAPAFRYGLQRPILTGFLYPLGRPEFRLPRVVF